MMDKQKFLKRAGFREETFKYGGVEIDLRELSLNQRRAVLEASKDEAPTEAIAALTVAMSSPMWSEDDVELMIESIRPDVLVAAAQRVYEISNMVDGGRADAKKPSAPHQRGNFFSRLHWPWGAQSES